MHAGDAVKDQAGSGQLAGDDDAAAAAEAVRRKRQADADALIAIKFMLAKAAIFILLPALVSVVVVYFTLK